jgi:3(or 17)beta-hydroxysteroid dehydrogenase
MAVGRDRLAGKVAVVTGGASGIGRATAAAMAGQGAHVVVADIDDGRGPDVAATIRAAGASASFLHLDVTREEDWIAGLGGTVGAHGRIDVLVNNAGIGPMGDIESTTLELWRRVQAVNVEGVFLGCKHAVRVMKESGGGAIVNLSSIAGIVSGPSMAAYSASKGAVRLLTKSVALHCARKGYNIRCNSVHPSYTDTPMVASIVAGHRDPDRFRSSLEGAAPLGRLGAPEDVADAILYLASDDARFVTGTELVVDGGLTAT